MSDLKKYYDLKKTSSSQYKSFLKLLSKKTTSRDFFSLSNGTLEPERQKLHKSIIDKYIKKYSSQTKPYIHLILGSIGSGKTSLKDAVIKKEEIKSFLYINFDELKKQLPEYEILKKLNPKKAAHFVQSESAKLAGVLYRKAVKQKINIIYEKNIRLNKEGGLHLISEMKTAFQKNYNVSIHVVFLNGYQEAWKRVKLRYEKIKRYVPKEYVKETYEDLFPNLNILFKKKFNKEYLVKFWYNGEWDKSFNVPKITYMIAFISFKKMDHLLDKAVNKNTFEVWSGIDHNNRKYYGGFSKIGLFLPKNVKRQLMRIRH